MSERDIHTDRQTDRQAGRQTDGQTDRTMLLKEEEEGRGGES